MNILRQQMESQLAGANYSESTIKSYVYAVQCLALHYGECPSQLSDEQVGAFLIVAIHHSPTSAPQSFHVSSLIPQRTNHSCLTHRKMIHHPDHSSRQLANVPLTAYLDLSEQTPDPLEQWMQFP